MSKTWSFTDTQKQRLRNIGVVPEQILELEKNLLWGALSVRKPGPQKSIETELAELYKALQKASKQISKLLGSSPETSRDRHLALARVEVADFEAGGDGKALERAIYSLAPAIAITKRALEASQRATRHTHAKYPVLHFVDKSLLEGFTKKHATTSPGAPLPPYEQRLTSTSNASQEVAAVFLEAVGESLSARTLPDYVQWRDKRTADSRGIEYQPRKRGRPKKINSESS